MAQIGTYKARLGGRTVTLPVYNLSDLNITSFRATAPDGTVGALPFFPLSDNPAYPALRMYHPIHGTIAPHSSSSMMEVIESWPDFSEWPDASDRSYLHRIGVGDKARHGTGVAEYGVNGAGPGSNEAINSYPGDGLAYYPSRGDGIPFGSWFRFNNQANDIIGFGWATQETSSSMYPTQYAVRFLGPDNAVQLVYDSLGGTFDVLAEKSINLDNRVGNWLNAEVARFDPVASDGTGGIRVHINDMAGGRLAVLEAPQEGRLDSGGFTMRFAKDTLETVSTRLWTDLLYYVP